MAVLRIGHRAFWSHVPLIGGFAPIKRQEDSLVMVPDLRIKVTQRPKGWFDFITGLNLLPLVVDWLKGKWEADGDHIVVDTGKRLVTIQADKLDLANIRLGDEIEFQLDQRLDPGGATYIKGKIVVINDSPDPKKPGGSAEPRKLDRPIDAADPVGDLIVRRAELFQAFKDGQLSQEDLRWTWDELRAQALAKLNAGERSYYERQDAYAQLLEFGVFTVAELGDKGVLLADYGISRPKQEEPLQA